jgi:hypothetical protein
MLSRSVLGLHVEVEGKVPNAFEYFDDIPTHTIASHAFEAFVSGLIYPL